MPVPCLNNTRVNYQIVGERRVAKLHNIMLRNDMKSLLCRLFALLCCFTCNELHASMQVLHRRCVQVVHGWNVQMADTILLNHSEAQCFQEVYCVDHRVPIMTPDPMGGLARTYPSLKMLERESLQVCVAGLLACSRCNMTGPWLV